jgi:AAA15 family ATPase/GTPase
MEDNHLKSFEVSGFKKFDNLKLKDLGQFNLIIGDNNVGKTSLLEALLADHRLADFFYSLGAINFNVKKIRNLTVPFINMYFSANKNTYPKSFSVNSEYKTLQPNEFTFRAQDEYTYTIDDEGISKNNSIKYNLQNSTYENPEYNFNVPFIPMGNFYSHEITTLFSKNIQDNVIKKELFLNALKNLIPNIKYIELSLKYSSNPILVVTENNKNDLIPLASYGDGVLKLFRIALALFSHLDIGRLMIDEIDAGIHYSHLQNFITSLLKVSKEEKKQIFATTHSKECIENFTKALEETGMQDEGRIIHLADTKNGIKAFTMRYAEFENSIMAESEIR